METAIIDNLKEGGVGVLPTDTLYGLVGKAHSESAVERIYKLKRRSLDKPTIVLIGSRDQLDDFGVEVDFYVDQGELKSKPSPLIKVEGQRIEVLREGAVEVTP